MVLVGGGLVMALLVGLVGLTGWLPVGGTPEEEGSEPAAGYRLVEHDSGALRVEVPSEWDVLADKDGTFEGDVDQEPGDGDGPAITATPDLSAWEQVSNAAVPDTTVPGTHIVASREAAQEYTQDELVKSGFNDLSKSTCQASQLKDFRRSPYSGRIQTWRCENDSAFTALAAAPEGSECVVVLRIRTYDEDDREAAQRILDTFELDCARTS